jgi:hypothetical protein
MIIERPSAASIWQPLLEDRPKETLLPKALSIADLSSAWHTGLVSSLPLPPLLSSPPSSEDDEADEFGVDEEDGSSEEVGEPDGDAVT